MRAIPAFIFSLVAFYGPILLIMWVFSLVYNVEITSLLAK